MKLYSWNVNGIRAVLRKDAMMPFIQREQPDILALQETKAEQHQADVGLPEYEQHWNSAGKKGYSGTAIFSKIKPLSVINGFTDKIVTEHKLAADDYGDPTSEGRIITAEFEKFYLVNVYTPNSKRELTRLGLRHKQWDPAFLKHCKTLETAKPVIFCGDLNVAHTELDLANPASNRGEHGFTDEERAGFQAFVDAGFVDTFRLFHRGNGYYTWWVGWGGARERNVGWRIDYIMVSASLKDKIRKAEIHPDILGSDHCPVSITLDI